MNDQISVILRDVVLLLHPTARHKEWLLGPDELTDIRDLFQGRRCTNTLAPSATYHPIMMARQRERQRE